MTPAPLLQLLKAGGLVAGAGDISAADGKQVGPHHATVEPVNDAAASDAADHANVRPVDLGDNVADKVFWKSESIRHFRRDFHRSHCIPPHCGRVFSARTRRLSHAQIAPCLGHTTSKKVSYVNPQKDGVQGATSVVHRAFVPNSEHMRTLRQSLRHLLDQPHQEYRSADQHNGGSNNPDHLNSFEVAA